MINTYIISSPLEQFEINPFISLNIPLMGYLQFSLTNFGFYAILTLLLTFGLFIGANNNERINPNYWSVGAESLIHTANNIVKIQIGEKNGEYYFPFIFTLFTFILFANLISLVPYNFAITSHLVATLSLSLAILIGVTIIGFSRHKIKFFARLVPAGAPKALLPFLIILELVSYIAQGISLGLRLAMNLFAGHCLMVIIAGSIYNFMFSGIIPFIISPLPLVMLIAISGLELAIAFIQAYVFSLLTSIYIRDSLELAH